MRVAKVLLLDADGYVLVLRRSKTHPIHAGEPDLPGGIIEHSESYEEGLVREIYEEVGITVQENQLKLLATKERFHMMTKRLYKIQLTDRPDISISWEHDQWQWVAPQDIAGILVGSDSYLQFAREHLDALY